MGAARTTSSSAGSGPGASRSRATRGASRATSTTRSSRCVARPPTRTPARSTASASSTRATSSPRPRSTRSTRPGSASASSPETFAWTLEPGDAFATPGGGPRLLGCRARRRCATPTTGSTGTGWRAAPGATARGRSSSTTGRRPTSASTRPSCVEIATSARDLGVELFVLDDGWFGARDYGRPSLGDWFVDRRKLPERPRGPRGRRIEALGLTFGLWIEPEMVSERSELFAAHPDWAIGVPGRPRTESRQQLVLDMSRPEVVDHLVDVLSEVLSSAPISYVKWDMNRNITEPYSAALPADRQGEFFHRYVLGVYDLYAPAGGGLPDDPVRVVRQWRRPVRPGHARVRAAGLDERRHGRRRAPRASSGGPRWSTRRARWAPTSPPSRTTRPAGSRRSARARPSPSSAPSATSWTRPRCPRTTGPRSPTRSRSTRPTARSSSAAGSSGCAARSRATATRPPGWPSHPTRARPSSACTGRSTTPCPPADRLRLRGLDPARSYRVSAWPAGDEPLARANAGIHGGDELMAVGLTLSADRHAGASWGDFRAWLFVLEAV